MTERILTPRRLTDLVDCPFCGACSPHLVLDFVPNTQGNRKFVRCLECHAQGPWSTKAINELDGWGLRAHSSEKTTTVGEIVQEAAVMAGVNLSTEELLGAINNPAAAGEASSSNIRGAMACGALSAVSATNANFNAAPREGVVPPADPATNGEHAAAAPIPAEFAQIAKFYDVDNMADLVRMQEEHIDGLQAKLPKTPPFPGINRVREG